MTKQKKLSEDEDQLSIFDSVSTSKLTNLPNDSQDDEDYPEVDLDDFDTDDIGFHEKSDRTIETKQ